MTTAPEFKVTSPVIFLHEPPPAASDIETFACLRLDLLDQTDADLILRGLVDVPTSPRRRLKLLPWQRAHCEFLHAEQIFFAGLERGRELDMTWARRTLDRTRCRAQVARLRHQLRRLLRSVSLELMSGTRNLVAVVEGEAYDDSETILFTFHVATPVAQVRKLLVVYLRGRAHGRDE